MEIKASFVEIVSVSDKALKRLNIFYRNYCVFFLASDHFCRLLLQNVNHQLCIWGFLYNTHSRWGSVAKTPLKMALVCSQDMN